MTTQPTADAPLSDDELREIEKLVEPIELDYGLQDPHVDDSDAIDAIRRLVAEVRRVRAENVKFKHDVTAIVEREVHRAEAMGNGHDYPKEYVDGRYRTAIEILGEFRMMFVAPNFPTGRITADVTAKPGIVDVPTAFHVGQRVRTKGEKVIREGIITAVDMRFPVLSGSIVPCAKIEQETGERFWWSLDYLEAVD